MHCAKCKKIDRYLFQTLPTTTSWRCTAVPISLCGHCLVGHSVPAYRPSVRQWHFGTVEKYHAGSHRFTMAFDNDSSNSNNNNALEREILQLEKDPLDAYTAHHRAMARGLGLETHPTTTLPARMDTVKLKHSSNNHHAPVPAVPVARTRSHRRGDGNDMSFTPPPPFKRLTRATMDPTSPVPTMSDFDDAYFFDKRRTTTTSSTPESVTVVIRKAPQQQQPQRHQQSQTTSLSCEHNDTTETDDETAPKAGPRLWTLDEDETLRGAILACSHPLKWPDVARLVPHRTGKQCRERYYNHLKPTLKLEEWTPVEDALLCRVHCSLGSKWATISRFLPGRTDNGVKNRFHHIRRRIERAASKMTVQDVERVRTSSFLKLLHVTPFLDSFRFAITTSKSNSSSKNAVAWHVVAAIEEAVMTGNFQFCCDYDFEFGPFRKANSELCVRCGLLVPSKQTGDKICRATGWCWRCTRTIPHVSDNLLRRCLAAAAAAADYRPRSAIV